MDPKSGSLQTSFRERYYIESFSLTIPISIIKPSKNGFLGGCLGEPFFGLQRMVPPEKNQ